VTAVDFRGCRGEEPGTKSSATGAKAVTVLAEDLARAGPIGEDVVITSFRPGGCSNLPGTADARAGVAAILLMKGVHSTRDDGGGSICPRRDVDDGMQSTSTALGRSLPVGAQDCPARASRYRLFIGVAFT